MSSSTSSSVDSATGYNAANAALPKTILAALSTLAELKQLLETPVHVTDAPSLQPAVSAAINKSIDRLREIEAVGNKADGVVDPEIVEFVSNTTSSHPDVLLQNKLQEALDAKAAADIRCHALKAFSDKLELAPPPSSQAPGAEAGKPR